MFILHIAKVLYNEVSIFRNHWMIIVYLYSLCLVTYVNYNIKITMDFQTC